MVTLDKCTKLTRASFNYLWMKLSLSHSVCMIYRKIKDYLHINVEVHVNIPPVCQDQNRSSLQQSRKSISRCHSSYWFPSADVSRYFDFLLIAELTVRCCIAYYFDYLFLPHITFPSKSISLVSEDRNWRIIYLWALKESTFPKTVTSVYF